MRTLARRTLPLAVVLMGLLLLAVSHPAGAQGLLMPMPRSLVNDSAQLLSPAANRRLERMLRDYEDSTSTQIFVVTTRSFKRYDANYYATTLGNQWGGGQRGKNNGIVVLIRPGDMPAVALSDGARRLISSAEDQLISTLAGGDSELMSSMREDESPSGAEDEPAGIVGRPLSIAEMEGDEGALQGNVFTMLDNMLYELGSLGGEMSIASRPAGDYGEGYIATGYGMDHLIPDAVAARIVRRYMGPLAVAHEYELAIFTSVLCVMECASGAYQADEPARENPRQWAVILFAIIALLTPSLLATPFLLIGYLFRKDKSLRLGAYFWPRLWQWNMLVLMFLLTSGRSSRRGGSSGGGGGFSGGFGGGGGGSFGGGGGGGRF